MIMPGPDDDLIRITGGQVDDITLALIDKAYDDNEQAKEVIFQSLCVIGRQKPRLVLSSAVSFLKKHPKLCAAHRIIILKVIENIIKDCLENVDARLAAEIISLATTELSFNESSVPEWQDSAGNVLVAIGKRYCNDVMENLLLKLQPGCLPHESIIETIGNLSITNAFDMVPHLTAILGTMLPMMGMAKTNKVRKNFASALCKFCEAILDYVANIENAPDQSVTKYSFSAAMFSAYEILSSLWMQTKNIELQLTIVEALGNMSHLMTRDKLEEQLPRLLKIFLGLYKHHSEPYNITEGLSMVLDAACQEGSLMLQPHIDGLFTILFSQACIAPDYKNPMSLKNHNELMRCFALIARCFSSSMLGLLLTRLTVTNEKVRIGTLSILKHLINAAASHMEDKKVLLVAGLLPITQDNSNKVKKVFAQVIIAMAHHGYLELEGGHQMVEFIVNNCNLPTDLRKKSVVGDPDAVTNEALRTMCEHVLTLVTTTIDHMAPVLWPYLLELLQPNKYYDSMVIVCQNLTFLAKTKREQEADDFMLDFDTEVNIPKPAQLFCRLFMLAGKPKQGHGRSMHSLTLMQALSPNIDVTLVSLWDSVIPKLIKYLQDNDTEKETWNQKTWEDLILKLLSKSLDVIDNEDWYVELGKVIALEINLLSHVSHDKNTLFKCLGIVLRKSTKTTFVMEQLDVIFKQTKHNLKIEREGCAIAFGYAGTSHLDSVLVYLESALKMSGSKRQSGGFLGFIKDKAVENDPEKIKSTLILTYGCVARFAPSSLIVSRLETNILRTILPHFSNVKDKITKQCLIHTTQLIAEALHTDNLQEPYSFQNRIEFLTHLQNYMRSESLSSIDSETRALALNACAELVKLDPPLSDSDAGTLVKTSLASLIPLPVGGLSSKKSKENSDEIIEAEVLMSESYKSLHRCLTEILMKDVQPSKLFVIYQHLVPWLTAVPEYERERAIEILYRLLCQFYSNVNMDIYYAAGNMQNLGSMIGRLVPRVTDPSLAVRHHATDCIYKLCKIQTTYHSPVSNDRHDLIEKLLILRDRLQKTDPSSLFNIVNDLAKIIAKTLPNDQLMDMFNVLSEALTDHQSHSSSGACVVLNCLMKLRGSETISWIEDLLSSLYKQLNVIQCPQTRAGALRSIRTLASHHLIPVLSCLLKYPLPFDAGVVDIIHILSEDNNLVANMLEHLLELNRRSLPFDEKVEGRDNNVVRSATLLPIAIFSVFKEIFRVQESQPQVLLIYHRLFTTLVVRIGAMVGVQPPKPSDKADNSQHKKKFDVSKLKPNLMAIDALREFFQLTNDKDILEELEDEGCWIMLQSEYLYPDGVTVIARSICKYRSEMVAKIVSCMSSCFSSLYDKERVVCAAFFSELINQRCAGDEELLEMLMNTLLGRLVDSSHDVRTLCIRGMGNIASMGADEVQRFATTVLSALMAGMDDKEDVNDTITLEAMTGFTKILSEIGESHIRAILINISLRIRPCFEKPKAAVRAQAIILFGHLSRFGGGPSQAPFLEQIHSNLVSLLLHLNDSEDEVKKACKTSLRKLGPLIQSDEINEMFQRHLFEDANLFYGEFMNNLSKSVIKNVPDKINFYIMGCVSFFKSDDTRMQSNAAMFCGFLMGNLPKTMQSHVSKEHVCAALILLLKNESASVRISAAESMSLLHDY